MRTESVLIGACLLACGWNAAAEMVNGIEAVVDDSVITYHEVTTKNPMAYENLLNLYSSRPTELEKQLDKLRAGNLDLLVNNELIMHEFKTAGYSLPESVLNDIVQERIKAKFGDRATLDKTLQQEGITTERFRAQVREQFIIDAMRAKNISQEIIISPHKVEAYYQAHKDDFKVEDQVKLRAIVLRPSDDTNAPPANQLANDLLMQLNQGAPFEDLAKVYSQGEKQKSGGEWGWYEKSQLSKGLADIASEVPAGKYSRVFSRTRGDDYWIYEYNNCHAAIGRHYGVDPVTHKEKLLEERHFAQDDPPTNLPPANEFYLLKVEKTKPQHFKPLSEVRDLIERNLLGDERDRLEKQWLEKLRKKTFIKRYS